MAIYTKDVVGKGTEPVLVGSGGAGFRVEPIIKFPFPEYPVTVRAYVDDVTFVDHVMRDDRIRWPGEGFSRLELLAAGGSNWRVTVYTTAKDWDEATPALRRDALGRIVVAAEAVAKDVNGDLVALEVDTFGRLRCVADSGLTLITSGTLNVATGGAGTALLGSMEFTADYRFLCLRIGNPSFIGGTGPTAQPGIRSVTPPTFGGAGQPLTLHTFTGGNAAAGAAAEVQVGQTMVNSGVIGSTRTYGGRVLFAQCVVTFTGSPTGYTVPWELWGER
jgi:hypothetical protein